MKTEDLTELHAWFSKYVSSFITGNIAHDRNIVLKEEHTRRVCQEIRYIGQQLGMDGNDLFMAEVMALFHDIGRFEQFAHHGTFVDRVSVDHAELGVKIIEEKDVLKDLAKGDQGIVIRSILYHNRRDLPVDETDSCLHFSRMLRDADKLDIWNVFSRYYRNGDEDNSVLIQNFPDTPGISPKIYHELINARIANYADVENLNDFKLLQVGWVYDVNFRPSFQRIHEREYLKAIYDNLPKTDQVDEIFLAAQSYLSMKLQPPS